MRYWVPIKEYEEMQAYADQLLGELAATMSISKAALADRDRLKEEVVACWNLFNSVPTTFKLSDAVKTVFDGLATVKAERDAMRERAEQAEAERDDLQYESPIIRELREILGLDWGESITERCKELTTQRHPVPIPTDAQVDVMARAFRKSMWDGIDCWDAMKEQNRDNYRAAIRAAIAAGGLEPCAPVPVKVRFDCTWQQMFDAYLPSADAKYEQHILDYLAAHAVIDAPAGVPSVEDIYAEWKSMSFDEQRKYKSQSHYIYNAVLAGVAGERQALTETGKTAQWHVPTDADTLEKLAEMAFALYYSGRNLAQQSGPLQQEWKSLVTAILRAAKPRLDVTPQDLRDWVNSNMSRQAVYERINSRIKFGVEVPQVGWELDMTADQLRGHCITSNAEEFLAYLRSRIRPTFECQECAKMKEQRKTFRKIVLDGAAELRAVYEKAYFAALGGAAQHIDEANNAIVKSTHGVAIETVRQWPAMQAELDALIGEMG